MGCGVRTAQGRQAWEGIAQTGSKSPLSGCWKLLEAVLATVIASRTFRVESLVRCAGVPPAEKDLMSTVVVVGAGIVGSSVAYHLAREGVSVTLIDRAPSPAAGVTRDSFAWIVALEVAGPAGPKTYADPS